MSLIHKAAEVGDVDTLRRLLAEGVSPNAVDIDDNVLRGQMPLHVLSRNDGNMSRNMSRVACFELLRDAGANLDATDRYGYKPLHSAAEKGDATIVPLLVEAGATVDVGNNHGETALLVAASRDYRSYTNCVEVLLAAGASVNARDDFGRRPFNIALSHNCRRTWPLFLRAGAEIPTDRTEPYIIRVRNAGGFKRYEQAHLARITSILAPTPRLPPEMVRKIVEFWLHAGFY